MEILEIFPDYQSKVRLSDGRTVVFSPVTLAGTRTITAENGLEIGLIQKLYSPSEDSNLYLITEVLETGVKVTLEYEVIQGLSREVELIETWLRYQEKQSWILEEKNGAEILKEFFYLCPTTEPLDQLLGIIQHKDAFDRKRHLVLLWKVLFLYKRPELREKPQNIHFWNSVALPLFRHLGLNIS